MEFKTKQDLCPYFSETLEEFDADIDDSIESQGETTVYLLVMSGYRIHLKERQGSSSESKKSVSSLHRLTLQAADSSGIRRFYKIQIYSR